MATDFSTAQASILFFLLKPFINGGLPDKIVGRRREETVDKELLAQMESGDEKIRVKVPNERVNEMFAIADQILGGRRIRAICADGEERITRIPGKMRRRQWVREGDLIIIQPWDFQPSKADVKMRYTKTQALYLSRKGVLPEIVDVFGMGSDDTGGEDDGIWDMGADDTAEPVAEVEEETAEESDDDTADEA
jgi:translation initiation factor 1A